MDSENHAAELFLVNILSIYSIKIIMLLIISHGILIVAAL
jgi:hypothetical protein